MNHFLSCLMCTLITVGCVKEQPKPTPEPSQQSKQPTNDGMQIPTFSGARGVAVLLEIASLFKKHRPQIGVDLVLFDGEDYGLEGDLGRYLLGSRYFAAKKPPDYTPRFGILLDMVGDKFLDIPKEQHSV